MAFDKIFSFLKSSLDTPTLDTDYVSLDDSQVLQPLTQLSSSNQSLSLLQAFCSDEETVKSYLQNDELNNQSFFDQPMTTFDYCMENWFTFNDPINKSHDLWTIQNSAPVQNAISSQSSTDQNAAESHIWSENSDENFNLKMNFIHLVERGYKLFLSLNIDNSEVDEPWNPEVSKKILSVNFSFLSLRSEYLSSDVELDGYELLIMNEALVAFKSQKHLNLFGDLANKGQARATPENLISICNGIKGYKKIATNTKISLLSKIYYQLNLMEAIYTYDDEIDGWSSTEFKYDRRDTFLFNQLLHDGIVNVIETFPDRLRNDINVIILTYLIIIFNPDVPGLKHLEAIRHEQYSYIYLLRRYIRTICKSDCEATDNHYRLMVKIEKIVLLDQQTRRSLKALLNEPLAETITKAVAKQRNFQFC